MVTPAQILEIHDEIARELAVAAGNNWERIVINYEMDFSGERIQHNSIAFSISISLSGQYIETTLSFADSTQNLFRKLNEAHMELHGNYWASCEMALNANGKYTTEYTYGQPKRINAIIDHDSYWRFNTYIEDHMPPLNPRENSGNKP